MVIFDPLEILGSCFSFFFFFPIHLKNPLLIGCPKLSKSMEIEYLVFLFLKSILFCHPMKETCLCCWLAII